MKLHFHKHPHNNFGDDLNAWLWEHFLPDLSAPHIAPNSLFIGIGTLLNSSIPKSEQYEVFGTGVGYGKGLPDIDSSWKFHCVRGPLSAQTLGLPESTAVADPGILVRRVTQLTEGKKIYRFSYMPHVDFGILGNRSLKTICADLGFGFIDPRMSFEQIRNALDQTEILITEAMHGAIVADALGLPWIPVRSHHTILSYKWQDWCQSVKVPYNPTTLTTVFDFPGPFSWSWPKRHLLYPNPLRMLSMKRQLRQIAATVAPTLSQRTVIEDRTQELEHRLEAFRREYGMNALSTSDRTLISAST
ncbi:polysaccharide pyruvyl transferase family protein [Vampirovibrio sp.]|uniref:polysaccharide pyruvyl transferase family protein n=1 Tax=Vampirovibrio sp. TaxID=2717857 RepID=UPI0035932CDC